MKNLIKIVLTGLCIAGILTASGHAFFFGNDEPVPLEEVPKEVMETARGQFKDFRPESAEKETGKKYTVYEIEGIADGKRYSVTVKMNKGGDVIKVYVEEEDD